MSGKVSKFGRDGERLKKKTPKFICIVKKKKTRKTKCKIIRNDGSTWLSGATYNCKKRATFILQQN